MRANEPNPVEIGKTTVAIATAILTGDFKSSSAMVEDLNQVQTHGLVGGLVALFRGMSLRYASVTGDEVEVIETEMLSNLGAVLAQMEFPS